MPGRGPAKRDAGHAFAAWLSGHPGVGTAAAERLVEQARHGDRPGVTLLGAWLAESGLGGAPADVPALLAPESNVRTTYARRRTMDAIVTLAAKHGIQPGQFVHAKIDDLEMDGADVVWRLSGANGGRPITLDDRDMQLVRRLIEEGRDGKPRVGPADPLLLGWTVGRVKMLLRRARSDDVASRTAALAVP